jgi:hypothetical protein
VPERHSDLCVPAGEIVVATAAIAASLTGIVSAGLLWIERRYQEERRRRELRFEASGRILKAADRLEGLVPNRGASDEGFERIRSRLLYQIAALRAYGLSTSLGDAVGDLELIARDASNASPQALADSLRAATIEFSKVAVQELSS